MYSPISTSWDSAIRDGGQRVTVVDIYATPGLDNPSIANVPVSSFNVVADRRSANRRSGSVLLTDEELVSLFKDPDSTSPLKPYGSEIAIRTGVVYANGSTELIPLGRFGIEKLSWSEPDVSIQVELVDRSKIFERIHYPFPTVFAGYRISTAMNNIVVQGGFAVPGIQLQIDASLPNIILPGGTIYDSNYLDILQSLASLVGAEFYFDVNGVGQVRPIPFVDETTIAAEADWIVNAGDRGVMVSADRSVSRVDTYNAVTVLGQAPDSTSPQPRAIANDYNPSSPTYILGPFGVVNLNIQKNELTTNAACQAVALAQLKNSSGLSKALTLTSIGNPALQEGDTVLVRFPDGTEELHLIDRIDYSDNGTSSIETRVQRGV